MNRDDDMKSWNELLADASGEDEITDWAPNDADTWADKFDTGYGGSQGKPVLAWSKEYVYFPVVYDGMEWMERAPRNPRADGQRHVGGE